MELPFRIDLKSKTAVVTGGGGVLCSSFARALAACGAAVAVLDLDEKSAQEVADGIVKEGGKARGIACDVLNVESLKKARDDVAEHLGTADILINGAGGNHPAGTTSREYLEKDDLTKKADELTTFFDLDPEGIRFVFDLNFLGTLMPTQVFAEDMATGRGGVIINVSSMNAFRPLTKIPAYSGAKAAVSNFTQWLAVHFSRSGIRVNALAPGFFLTRQNHKLLVNDDGSHTERAEKILAHTPLGRFGAPEDLLGTLLWLTDEKASGFITGTVIPIDGGFSAYSGV
jgi:NAD(P)-dependent dehydrogenase (short-subunit alcohol dehydrogenase family)